MQVGLGPGHIVLDGTQLPVPQRDRALQFLAHVCCGQMSEWIKLPLGRKVGLKRSDSVLYGDPAAVPKKRAEPALPFSAHVH